MILNVYAEKNTEHSKCKFKNNHGISDLNEPKKKSEGYRAIFEQKGEGWGGEAIFRYFNNYHPLKLAMGALEPRPLPSYAITWRKHILQHKHSVHNSSVRSKQYDWLMKGFHIEISLDLQN